jgi:hypothetical protein
MTKITRRQAMTAGIAAAALARPAIAQSSKQVTILTWNLPEAKPLID